MTKRFLMLWLATCLGLTVVQRAALARDITPAAPAPAAPPKSLQQIVADGKSATALLDTPNGHGAAFCIHTAGIFVTDAHLVAGVTRVRLVLYPGQDTQQVVTARVNHCDSDSDLALLAIDPPLAVQSPETPMPTALSMAKPDGLIETMPIAVFGYPFGLNWKYNEHNLPNVELATGHITGLRRIENKMMEIQCDAVTNLGYSGGPMVNEQGQVIGIFYAAARSTAGLNFAIPAEQLLPLLETPDVQIDVVPVAYEARHQRREWHIQVAPLPVIGDAIPAGTYDYQVQLKLGGDGSWHSAQVSPVTDGPPGTFSAVGRPVAFEGTEHCPVPYRIIVTQNDQVVAQVAGTIPLPGAPAAWVGPLPRLASGTEGLVGHPFTSPPAQNPTNGHWYRVVVSDHGITWDEADAAASNMKYLGIAGHLATISSAQEQAFIADRVLSTIPNQIGAYFTDGVQPAGSAEPAGGWKWDTDEPYVYTHWNGGEPNNAGGNENVIELTPTGMWNDCDGSRAEIGLVVEFDGPAPDVQPAATP